MAALLVRLPRGRHAAVLTGASRGAGRPHRAAPIPDGPLARCWLHVAAAARRWRARSERDDRPAVWDNFGIWDNRLQKEPIMLPPSIKYGKPIPQLNLARVGSASQTGRRSANEDRLSVGAVDGTMLYFAVYDGHGGAYAAEFCGAHMKRCIRNLVEQEEDLQVVLRRAFLQVNEEFTLAARAPGNEALLPCGTTATVALLRDGVELVVGSVGDSRAILCRRGLSRKLTEDHTPERRDEKERIQKCGGFIAWTSLGQPHVNGRLAMTRSIGDIALKAVGVTAEPDTRRIMLKHGDDSFLVLTTDGINVIMNSQEICNIVSQCNEPSEAAQLVGEQAMQYGSEDNTTVVVVPFGAWGKHKGAEDSYSVGRTFTSSWRWA
uniref:protein-serine/threonine phosphatase n=1 Tax=Petromyzon marinus TaxID=7757 RepID=A0AAJ7TWC3_PETMA|nr:protein phosphatase 1K, mitochondrial-like [Petromyzon marinus]